MRSPRKPKFSTVGQPHPKGGRPTVYNPSVHAKAVEAARLGLFRKLQAQYAGVSFGAYDEWMTHGRHHADSPYAQLVRDIEQAEGDRAVEAMRVVQGGEGGWQSAAWYLERKYPHEFGRKVQEVHGKDGGPMEFVVVRDAVLRGDDPED